MRKTCQQSKQETCPQGTVWCQPQGQMPGCYPPPICPSSTKIKDTQSQQTCPPNEIWCQPPGFPFAGCNPPEAC
jgi:hypothetical protein